MKRLLTYGLAIFASLGLLVLSVSCEKNVPLSSFDFDYTPEYKIEGDFFPANPGKSVVRIDHTFTIEDSVNVDSAHVTDASVELLSDDSALLSTLSWQDSADAYPYFDTEDFDGFDPSTPLDSLAARLDTMYYGAYKLDRVDFSLENSQTYHLRVTIDGESFETSFSPYPAVEFTNFEPDSITACPCETGPGEHELIHTTMASDTAKLRWAEDKDAYLYTVYVYDREPDVDLGPQIFTFPGPVFNLGMLPGTYDIIIGTMNETFYRHYYLSDFPPNHDTRNYFDGKALGYAGTLNERYVRVHVVPPGTVP